MKTKEELCALKEEVENVNKKLAELTEEELAQVSGGVAHLGTNTDVDRSTIKKEIDASIAQIDDNALLPFN